MMGRGYGFRLLSNRARNHHKLSMQWRLNIVNTRNHIPSLWVARPRGWGCVTRVVKHDTVSVATLWARVHSLEFDRPRVDSPVTTFASPPLLMLVWESGLWVYLCVWGDPVPYQGSAPPKRLIRAIIKGQPPCRVSHIPRLSTGNTTTSNQQAWLHKKRPNYLEQELVWQASSTRFCILCSFV